MRIRTVEAAKSCPRIIAGLAILTGAPAAPADELYSTGLPRRAVYVAEQTYVGFTSGYLSQIGAPVRWIAQPFSLPSGNHEIDEIVTYGFVAGGFEFETLRFRIFPRNGTTAPDPDQQLAEGARSMPGGFAGESIQLDPNAVGPWTFRIPEQSVHLTGGDYYLVVHADDPLPGRTQCAFVWFMNSPGGIPLLNNGPSDDPHGSPNDYGWMWRSENLPSPGFQVFQYPYMTYRALGSPPDNTRLYCAAFELRGTSGGPGPGNCPLPGCIGGGFDADFDGNCEVNLTDLAVLLSNFGLGSGATNAMGNTNPDTDGAINLTDLSVTLSRFGSVCHP